MDVHNRKGARQNGPGLSAADLNSDAKSQNHCAAVLVGLPQLGEGAELLWLTLAAD
jgi:hypothetical protein